MDRQECNKIYDELTALILATPSDLCWTIARELADYTVAFVVDTNGGLGAAGSGTLVSFNDSYYLLTAAHVWQALEKSDAIRIPLKATPGRFKVSPKEIEAFEIAPKHLEWNEWGPDIALLRLPRERVGSFTAVGRSFRSLSKGHMRSLSCAVEIWFLMGAPAVRGTYAADRAVPELLGMNVILSGPFLARNSIPEYRSKFDFVDVPMDTALNDVPNDFGGVSGGGLWRVYIYKDPATNQIESFKTLQGVAFWQEPIQGGMCVRCHGPQSIGSLLAAFLGKD